MKSAIRIFIFFLSSIFLLNAQPTHFSPRVIGGGGALFFPTINPENDNEFYVACDLSAMFHSLDYGKSYDQVDFRKLQTFNTSTYEFTQDPRIAYCNFNDGNIGFPVKTEDGGKTWKELINYNQNAYGIVFTLKANYHNPDQFIVGGYGDILISNDGGNSFNVIKHTANPGAGLTMGGVYWNGKSIYIGTNEGLLYSNNGGMSFSVMNTTGMAPGQIIWSFAGASENGNTRFVCIAANASDTYNGIMPWDYYNYPKAVYTMENANGVWVNRSAGIDFANDFVMYVGMASNNISTIYLGGSDNALSAPLVVKSIDGGLHWSKIFNTSNNANIITGWEGFQGDKNWSWSENCFGITVAPNNVNKVMFSTFSNVQLSDDGGKNWRQAYVHSSDEHPAGASTPKNKSYHSIGLENTTCWQVFWQDANTMMGCFSDIGGIRSVDGGKTWGYQYSGFSVNSLYRMVKGSNHVMYGACASTHDIYQSTRLQDAPLDNNDPNGKIVYSADNGATWVNLHVFNHPVYWIAIDPNNQNRMYASVIHYGGTQGSQLGGIYVSNDINKLAASTWMKLPNPPRTEGHPACIEVLNDGKVVCTFSGRRNNSGAFTASSGVFLYDPSSNSWKDVGHKDMNYWTKDIVMDPNDPSQNTWYVGVFSGWGGAPNGLGGLFKTTNRGLNWTKQTDLQFDRVTSITFNPKNLKQAYLTTETQGLWVSNNMDAIVQTWKLVEAYPFRQPERVFFNPYNQDEMWVSSFGNGMKVGNLNVTSVDDEPGHDSNQLVVYPNPGSDPFNIRFESDRSIAGVLDVYDMVGEKISSTLIDLKPGKNNYPFSMETDVRGLYFISLTTNEKKFIARLIFE